MHVCRDSLECPGIVWIPRIFQTAIGKTGHVCTFVHPYQSKTHNFLGHINNCISPQVTKMKRQTFNCVTPNTDTQNVILYVSPVICIFQSPHAYTKNVYTCTCTCNKYKCTCTCMYKYNVHVILPLYIHVYMYLPFFISPYNQ